MTNATEHAAALPTNDIAQEVARRRTFAIISHPDAGKTTLTEKLLLYSGAVDLAGSVRARSHQRRARSDWMEIEQQRGISVTSTALQFEYAGYCFNLLDTPGHEDFSEDTYRTLMAVDSAIMVLDAAKGIEPQTRKLFEVCRLRHIPIITFINKLDHPSEAPLSLLDQIERVLEIGAAPRNWPIGDGPSFQGVYDLINERVLRFERTVGGQYRAPVQVHGIDDAALAEVIGAEAQAQLQEEVELLAAAGAEFDQERFLAGEVTPVFFGSALNNFGVEPFLEALCEMAPPPGPRASDKGPVQPDDPAFSGFIFKIQANMDPQHRDSMAFLRICSGRFTKDMVVQHPRLGKSVRMSRPHRLFARDRETVEEAYPGDVVGLVNPGAFAIGDTLCTGAPRRFDAIPRFPPERFALLQNRDVSRYKQFQKGLAQLESEGAVQVLYPPEGSRSEPVLAAVGELQFDLVVARLKAEYGVETRLEPQSYTMARWLSGPPEALKAIRWSRGTLKTVDKEDRLVALFSTSFNLDYFARENPGVTLSELG